MDNIVNPLERYIKEWEAEASEEEKKKYEKLPKWCRKYPFYEALERHYKELSPGEKMLVHYNLEHGDWPVDAHIPKEKDTDRFHPPNILSMKLGLFRLAIEEYEIDKQIKEALRIRSRNII